MCVRTSLLSHTGSGSLLIFASVKFRSIDSQKMMKSLSALLCLIVIPDSIRSMNITNDSLLSSEEFSDDESSGSISIEVEDKRLKSMFDLVSLQYGYYGLAAELYNKTESLVRNMNGVQRLELLNKKLSELWAKVQSEPVETLGMEAGHIGNVVMNRTKHKVNSYCFRKTYLRDTLFYNEDEMNRTGKLFQRFNENVERLNAYFQPPKRESSHK